MPRWTWMIAWTMAACAGCAPLKSQLASKRTATIAVTESERVATSGPESESVRPAQPIQPVQAIRVDDQFVSSMSDVDGWAPVETALPVEVVDVSRPVVEINLPSALAVVGGTHPIVGLARWRTKEAYAEFSAAKALWLPSIRAGLSIHRHDGNYQASNGAIVDVNRNSLQYGLGVGATGAGTTQRPGLVAQFHLADAIFRPEITEKTAWARGHSAGATLNAQLRDVAVAYTDLVRNAQEVAILKTSHQTFEELLTLVDNFAAAGEGLQSDADRVRTETLLNENRLVATQQRMVVASARLTQAMSYDVSVELTPLDVNLVPLDLVASAEDVTALVQTGLSMRPELKASRALVAAACKAYSREKYASMVPSVLLGFSTGGFGGGLDDNVNDVDSRYDFDAMLSWEVRQFGLGEKAARQAASARVQQARYDAVAQMDRIAGQVRDAAARVRWTRQQISITQQAIEVATDSYRRNRDRIRDGEGLPIEVLQSVQSLEASQLAYLQAVSDHNTAQFQLQWAMGYPVG